MDISKLRDEKFRENGCKAKHDRICDIIAAEFERRNWEVENELFYDGKGRLIGDYDVIAKKGIYCAFTEVKSTHSHRNLKKARDQLARAYVHAKREFDESRHFPFYGTADPNGCGVKLVRLYERELPNTYDHLLSE